MWAKDFAHPWCAGVALFRNSDELVLSRLPFAVCKNKVDNTIKECQVTENKTLCPYKRWVFKTSSNLDVICAKNGTRPTSWECLTGNYAYGLKQGAHFPWVSSASLSALFFCSDPGLYLFHFFTRKMGRSVWPTEWTACSEYLKVVFPYKRP